MDWRYDTKELENAGVFNEIYPHAPQLPRYAAPVSARENYLRFLRGEKPLWMPMHDESIYFAPQLIPDVIARGGGGTYDAEPVDVSRAGGPDLFGVDWVYVPEVQGSMPRPGVQKVPDLEHWENYIVFPDLDSLDWAASAEKNRDFLSQGFAVSMTVHNGLFERLVSLCDMSDTLMGMVDEDVQPAIHRLFDRLCVFYDEYFARIKKWYGVDQLWFHDDWGSQRAPLFSLDTCREMLVPYLRRLVESAHKYGIFFELHSCGKIEKLVPAMIEAGVDSWRGQPLNDKERLFEEYGDRLLLGIEPTSLKADTTDMTALERDCQRFVDRYAKSGRVFCSMFAMPPKAREYVYAMSRQALWG